MILISQFLGTIGFAVRNTMSHRLGAQSTPQLPFATRRRRQLVRYSPLLNANVPKSKLRVEQLMRCNTQFPERKMFPAPIQLP